MLLYSCRRANRTERQVAGPDMRPHPPLPRAARARPHPNTLRLSQYPFSARYGLRGRHFPRDWRLDFSLCSFLPQFHFHLVLPGRLAIQAISIEFAPECRPRSDTASLYPRPEEHTSELPSLMSISYGV